MAHPAMRAGPQLDNQTIRITTIDPSQRLVEGVLKDGAPIRIAVWEVPTNFRWPVEGETWTVCRRENQWFLDSAFESDNEEFPIESLNAGETKIGSNTIYVKDGRQVVAVDISSAVDGMVVTWTSDGFALGLSAAGGTAAVYEHTVAIPANPWTWSHGLGRKPVGIEVFDTSGNKIEADIQADNGTITISLSGAMAGSATYV